MDDDVQQTCTCTFPTPSSPSGSPPASEYPGEGTNPNEIPIAYTCPFPTLPPPSGAYPPARGYPGGVTQPTYYPTVCTCAPHTPPTSGACCPPGPSTKHSGGKDKRHSGGRDRRHSGGKTQLISNPPVPFLTSISGGIFPGKMIFVSGVPKPNANRFTINLSCGVHDGADVAFHFDVRLQINGIHNTIIRNTLQGGGWGPEERLSPSFPFIPNAKFDLVITAKPSKFKVTVNNQHLLEYSHRMKPLNRINALQILGDLQVTEVRL